MPSIPPKVYACVEWHLHHREELLREAQKRAQADEDDAMNGDGARWADNGAPRGTSKHADPTAMKAMKLIKGQQAVEQAARWQRAMAQALANYEGTMIGQAAALYYGTGEALDAVAARLGVNRQTIHRYRERVVCTCALYAAAEGLIRLPGRGALASAQEREKGADGEACERHSRRAQKAKGAQQAGGTAGHSERARAREREGRTMEEEREIDGLVLTMRPRHWEAILAGEMEYVVRKATPTKYAELAGRDGFMRCYVYLGGEVDSVVGYIDCDRIRSGLDEAGILKLKTTLTQKELAQYGMGRLRRLCAWHICGVCAYKDRLPLALFGLEYGPHTWTYCYL